MLKRLGVWRTTHVNRMVKNVDVSKKTKDGVTIKVNHLLADFDVCPIHFFIIF